MKTPQLPKRLSIILLILFSLIVLSGCGLLPGSLPGGGASVSVTGPEAGREKVLAYLRDHYQVEFPTGSGAWIEKNITPAGVTTSAAYEYTAENWIASIIFRMVDPAERVYRVTVTNPGGFRWEGQVNAYGQVTETSFSEGQGFVQVVPSPTSPEPELESTPTPTTTFDPAVSLYTYRDETYRLEFQYSSSWSITTLPAGRNVGIGFSSKTIELNQDDIKLVIQYKSPWERTVLGSDIPGGSLEIRRVTSLLGQKVPIKFIVENGVDIYLFLTASFPDLAFDIHLETNTGEIPANVQAEAEQIIASIVRTGEPLPTPTLPPTPLPTSKWGSTRSGSGSGSTVSEDCNKASFVAHVSVPEGSIMLPGVNFTKIWRIKNVGICTWTKAYKLVFSTGDLMGANKSVALPADVPPGSTVDIKVDFTSPDKLGHYQGYWILNDDQGYWFGLGDQKKGFIPIDIVVVEPNENYAYDFAIHYCEATWKNKEMNNDQKLPCPGSPSSSEGFVLLIANPALENRIENELALWVHPNEERNGWIQGTYPSFEVKSGDHFLAWVGCMADSSKCSIKFYLDYKDSDGDVHNLDSWIESYDGEITKINFDLSALDGQSVRFILKTEVLTNNVTAAQGFWFVPRIERP